MLARYYRYRMGFKGQEQVPWFMIWIEYFNTDGRGFRYHLPNQVEYAKVIWSSN